MTANVGYATLSIIPSFKGAKAKIRSEVGDPIEKETTESSEKGGEEGARRFSSKFVAGIAAAGIGAAITTGIVEGIGNEASSDVLAGRLGLDPGEQQRIGGLAGSIYADAYGDSFDGVGAVLADALTIDPSASDEALRGLTTTALNMETAFGGAASEYLTLASNLESQGVTASVDEGLDLLTASFQQLPSELIGPLQDAVLEYGPFLDDLGLSTQESFALLTAAAQDGEFALDKTGDALKEFGIRATDGSAASTAAYDAIGLDAETMANRLLAGGESARGAMDEVVAGLQGITDPSARAQAAIALFGTPLEDLSVQEIPAFLDSLANIPEGLGDAEGAAAALDDTLNSNSQAGIESYKRQAQLLLARVTELPGPFGAAGTAAAAFGGTALTAAGDVGAMVNGFGGLAKSAGTAAAGVIKSGASIVVSAATSSAAAVKSIALQTAAWVKMGVQSLLSAAKVAAAWLISLGPIALVVAAVVGLAILVYKNFDTIKAAISTAWEFVKEKTSAAWDFVTGKIEGAVGFVAGVPGRLASAFGDGFGFIRDKISAAKDWAFDRLDEVVGFVTGLPGRIATAAVGMFDGFLQPMRDVVNGLASIWNSTVGGFSIGIPDWVPTIGGNSFSIPNLPTFHAGGVVPGRAGEEVLVMAMAGETIRTEAQEQRLATPGPAGQARTINVDMTYGNEAELFQAISRQERADDALHGRFAFAGDRDL